MEHLVYCDKEGAVLEKLLNRSKTKIIRGAAGRKIPHSRVFAGEILYFVENDGTGEIKATAKVKSVFNSEKMTEEESNKLIEENSKELNLSKKQLGRWSGKKVLCLIEVEDVKKLETPMIYDRKKNMDDWIIVDHISDILVGSQKEFQNLRLK